MFKRKSLKVLIAWLISGTMIFMPIPTLFTVYAQEVTLPLEELETNFKLVQPNSETPVPLVIEIQESGYGGGTGTQEDPYIISTPNHLANLAKEVNVDRKDTTGIYYKVVQNIDLTDFSAYEDAANGNWMPIGRDVENPFKGHFDGNGFPISNLIIKEIDPTSYDYSAAVGLFGYVDNASLTNVYLPQITFNATSSYYVGALVGWVGSNTTIQNCFTHATISGQEMGGLIGHLNGNNNLIKECYVKGTLSSVTGFAGGIIGSVQGGDNVITQVRFDGTLQAVGNNIGGLIGQLANGEKGNVVSDSYALATVKGENAVGGLIGDVTTKNLIINSYFEGSVLHNSGGYKIGGLVGRLNENNAVYDCYAKGTVKGFGQVGGLIGLIDGPTNVIKDVYAECNVVGNNDVAGLIGAVKYTVYVNYTVSPGKNTATATTNNYIMDSYAKGTVTSNQPMSWNVGGIIGDSSGALVIERMYFEGTIKSDGGDVGGLIGDDAGYTSIRKSYVKATIQSSQNNVGGLVGDASSGLQISECYSISNLKGTENVGGLIGFTSSYRNSYITNTFSTGRVEGNKSIGGLIGFNFDIENPTSYQMNILNNSFSANTVIGKENVGGIVGGYKYTNTNLKVTNTYYNKDLASPTEKGVGKALTTSQMQGINAKKYMTGLDFRYQWSTQAKGYPVLLIY